MPGYRTIQGCLGNPPWRSSFLIGRTRPGAPARHAPPGAPRPARPDQGRTAGVSSFIPRARHIR